MKKILIVIGFFVMATFGAQAQYKTHKVKPGETIEGIAKTYKVTPFDIYALNPDAKVNLQPEMILVIPKSRIAETPTQVEEKALKGYKSHKVKRKETLYSIAGKYNITIEEIKKHNTRLYSENLRRGDKINIPQYHMVTVTNNLENTIRKYEVQPKEGKWRIAYKFGITVAELEQLNPGMTETLQVGQKINVPNIANNEEKAIDDSYGYYTVLPKEGYYRLKLKLGLTQEQLESLNPELKEGGLKAGMVLKVPKDVGSSEMLDNVEQSVLLNNLRNFETKRLAVMLPFRLNRVDLDSIREVKAMLKRDNYLTVSLDFHSGVLMALDSARQLGISTVLDVYDTKARVSEVTRLFNNNDFSNYDAVIGPFTSGNFDMAASFLQADNVPAISPVTKPNKLIRNVFQTIPSDEFLRKKMINFVKSDSLPRHIMIIADSKHRTDSNELKEAFGNAAQIFSRKNKEGVDMFYILKEQLEAQLKEGRNIVFLETDNAGFVANVTSMLAAYNGVRVENNREVEREIILMTTNKNRAFESVNISNYDLSNLSFHYPSVNRIYDADKQKAFVNRYKQTYGTEPNKYAVRGFDITMDILLRLATEDDLYDASGSDIETEYVENKFRYAKKLFGGYYNEAAYIVKYQDLQIVEVKQ